MAAMLQLSLETMECSRGFKRPANASIRMCVSSTSMPAPSGGQKVPLDLDSSFETAEQRRGLGGSRKQFRHGFAVLGDQQPLRADLVEQCQTARLELGRADALHTSQCTKGRFVCLVINSGHIATPPACVFRNMPRARLEPA